MEIITDGGQSVMKTLSCILRKMKIITGGGQSIHYSDVIMGAIGSQITSLTIVYSTVYSHAGQRKHQSSASLAFVRGIHRGPVHSPHKWPVTRKMFPFDDVIMNTFILCIEKSLSRNTSSLMDFHLMQLYYDWISSDIMFSWLIKMDMDTGNTLFH